MEGTLLDLAAWRPRPSELPAPSRSEMLRYLGHTGQQIDDALEGRIERARELAVADARVHGAHRAFRVNAGGADGAGEACIRLEGTLVELRGRDIHRHLKDARSCILLCCTLGMQTERRLRALGAADPLDAALYDAACSAYVEDVVGELDRRLRSAAAERGLAANWRFSCGYGDCPLDAQEGILAALDAGRLCGVTATDSGILLPRKSVTAMIGLFDGPVRDAASQPSCDICKLRGSCPYRARGTTCHARHRPDPSS